MRPAVFELSKRGDRWQGWWLSLEGAVKERKRKGKYGGGEAERRRGGAVAAGSLPESTTLKQVNSITNRSSQRKSRTRHGEDAAGGEGRWASDENQTSGHSCSQLWFGLPLWFSSKGLIPLSYISTIKATKLFL